MESCPEIATGSIGEAGVVGQYLKQRYPQEAIVSSIGEAVDDQGVRCYLPTFGQEAARVYQERPDEAIAYSVIGGRQAFLDITTTYLLGSNFHAGYIARVGAAGLTSVLYISLHVLSKGEDVLVPSPTWPSYAGMVEQLGGRYWEFPLLTEKERRLNIEGLEALLPKIGAGITLILNTPFHNPAAYTLTPEDLQNLRALLWQYAEQGKQIKIIIDPAYINFHWITPRSVLHDAIQPLLPLHDNVTLVVGWSLSKSYLAYGQRLGTLVMITNVAQRAQKLQQTLLKATRAIISTPATLPQIVVESIHADPVKQAKIAEEREQIRLLLVQRNRAFEKGVQEYGLTALPGDGGFFRAVAVPRGVKAVEVVRKLFAKRVAIVAAGDQHLRVAVCSVPEEKMVPLTGKIAEAIEELAPRLSIPS
jgi:aromatic-amino-acid transaminase